MDRVLAENERAAEQERARVILPREELKELPLPEAVEQIGTWEKELTASQETVRGGDPETDCGQSLRRRKSMNCLRD